MWQEVVENILNKNMTKTDAYEIWYQVLWNVIGTNTKRFLYNFITHHL